MRQPGRHERHKAKRAWWPNGRLRESTGKDPRAVHAEFVGARLSNRTFAIAAILILIAVAVEVVGYPLQPSTRLASSSASVHAVTTTTLISSYVNNVFLRQQAEELACRSQAGGWEATGSIKNSGSTPRDYRVTVFFTNDRSMVLASGETSLTLGVGEKGSWKVSARFPAPAHVLCALVGVG